MFCHLMKSVSVFQSCDNALTSSAASQCLNQLSSLLGPSILRGRVEQYNPRYVGTNFGHLFRGNEKQYY